MCGIVGILTRKTPIPPAVLEQATASLAHRGPDDSGTVLLKESQPEPLEIALGHRRLAILDLSPLGHQPMQDPVTGNWIVFNGEIYNFRDLRKELEATGAEFKSHSDTEVILAAYRVWGESCLTRLGGMFAFALWDAPRKRLLLARDPMGIKPLYYHQSPQSFLTYWIVAMPLGLAWIVLRNRRVRFWLLPIGLGPPLAYKVWISHGPVDWTTLCAGVGAVVLMDVLLWSFRSRDQWRIACALWLLLPLAILQYMHLPVKFLVPCAPRPRC